MRCGLDVVLRARRRGSSLEAQTSAFSGAVDLPTLPSRGPIAPLTTGRSSAFLPPQERGHVERRVEVEIVIDGGLLRLGRPAECVAATSISGDSRPGRRT